MTVYSEPFIVTIKDTCLKTELITRELGPYFAEVGAGPKQVIIEEIKDTVSEAYSDDFGDGSGSDLCGTRDYKLFEEVNFQPVVPSFARLNERNPPNIVIESTDESEIGPHQMYLEVYLTDYADVMLYIPFIIEIRGCTISKLEIE